MARMICVNTFALNGNLTVTYKTLIFSNLYLYEFCENFANFIRISLGLVGSEMCIRDRH